MLKGRYNGTWSSKMADGWHEYEYDGFPSRDHGEIKEILFGKYASCFERLFLGKKLTLESHQTIWALCRSYSSHFSVKTAQRWGDYSVSSPILLTSNIKASQFVPAQQYSNTQRMIRAIFWSVATAQVNGIDHYFMFLDSTDPLEQNFGIVRELFGPGTQARTCLMNSVMECFRSLLFFVTRLI